MTPHPGPPAPQAAAPPVDRAAVDRALAAVRALIAARGAERRHHVAAAVITADGRHFLGISLESALGWASICAEPVAIGRALLDAPAVAITACLAVNRAGEIVPPCSRCRETLADFAPSARVALPEAGGYRLVPLTDLMPHAYKAALRFGAGRQE